MKTLIFLRFTLFHAGVWCSVGFRLNIFVCKYRPAFSCCFNLPFIFTVPSLYFLRLFIDTGEVEAIVVSSCIGFLLLVLIGGILLCNKRDL